MINRKKSNRKYYLKNKDKLIEYQKEYSKNNRKKINNRIKEYRKTHSRKEEYKKRYVENKLLYKKHVDKRNNLIKKYGGTHTLGEWNDLKIKYNYTCPCCNTREPDIILTVDHIVSVSVWGEWIKENKHIKYMYDDIKNIQPLCLKCNLSKQNKVITYRDKCSNLK